MADLKFSCAHCGQHISCDQAWSGHQIQCPTCQNQLAVPQLTEPSGETSTQASPLIPQPPTTNRPKLSAGSTQVARPAVTPAVTPQRQFRSRPPKTENPLLKYAVIAVVLAAIGGAAYLYLPGLLASATAPAGGGLGPMGDVNGAMDVSETLDGGGARQRPRAARAPAVRPPGSTNSASAPCRTR
jgi:hypothetical protein